MTQIIIKLCASNVSEHKENFGITVIDIESKETRMVTMQHLLLFIHL